MADRKNFFYKQRVTEAELDAAFDQPEKGIWDLAKDMGVIGVLSGLTPSLSGGAGNSNVDITSGIAISKSGKRLRAYTDGAGTKQFSYATDTAGAPTSVAGGQERWISIMARHGRKKSDPRTDGLGNPVHFQREEALNSTGDDTDANVDKFYIVAGASAPTGTATRPALDAEHILVADIKRTPSDAANVLDLTRREIMHIPIERGIGSAGLALRVPALTTWKGGRTNPGEANLAAQLNKFIDDLAAETSNDDGAERIGAANVGALIQGSVRSQLDQLQNEKGGKAQNNTWTAAQTFSAAIILNSNLSVTGTADIDGAVDMDSSLDVATTLVVGGNTTFNGATNTFANKVRLTLDNAGGSQEPGIDTTATVPTAERHLLFETNYTGGQSDCKIRFYLNNLAILSNGPRRSLLITTNARWDGTNWNKDNTTLSAGETGASFAVEIGGIRGTGNVSSGGLIFYRQKISNNNAAWTDSNWSQKIDMGDAFDDNDTGNTFDNNFADFDQSGTTRYNLFNGDAIIGINAAQKRYAFHWAAQATGAFTFKNFVPFNFRYSAVPSSFTFTTTTNTNMAVAGLSASQRRGVTVGSAVTGAGTYELAGSVLVKL